jgi:hypothetical protein
METGNKMEKTAAEPLRRLIYGRFVRVGSLISLVFAVALSPRIPLPVHIPGRVFDLRVEDVLLLVFFILFVAYSTSRRRITVSPPGKAMFVYLFVSALATFAVNLYQPSDISRFFFYFLKEIQYFLIFLLFVNWPMDTAALAKIVRALMVAALLNVCWVAAQFMTGIHGQLLNMDEGVSGFYTIGTIGEVSPFSVAGYFSLCSFVFYSFSVYWSTRKSRRLMFLSGCACTLSAIVTGEKIAVVFFVIGAVAMVILKNSVRVRQIINKLALTAGIFLLSFVLIQKIPEIFPSLNYKQLTSVYESTVIGQTFPSAARVLDIKAYGRLDKHRQERWHELVGFVADHFWLGAGKGSKFTVAPGVVLEETHNNFIKVFAESGIAGFLSFIALLVAAVVTFASAFVSSEPGVGKALGAAAFSAVVAMTAASCVQDAFKPVLLNEMFWIIAGLAIAARRLDTARGS